MLRLSIVRSIKMSHTSDKYKTNMVSQEHFVKLCTNYAKWYKVNTSLTIFTISNIGLTIHDPQNASFIIQILKDIFVHKLVKLNRADAVSCFA